MKQALVEIHRLRKALEFERQSRREPIALVGVGIRVPGGVASLDDFSRLLQQGEDGVGPIPDGRWPRGQFFAPGEPTPGKYYVQHGGFLDAVDQFDPEFFGIAPLEASTMDPQQRVLLETMWESLEDAGIPASGLRGSRSGVFVGIGTTDYQRMVLADPRRVDTYAATGTAFSVASGRMAYLLGLEGPALSVDTACSSSLVAIHLACQSLRSGESDLALAGGVNLILSPELTINFCQAGMLSRDGRCKTFDASADGYVRSEGCGMVVLKRLSDAQRDGDRMLAVIRGSAVNQDGRSSGLTAPSGSAQEAVIRDALANAGLSSADIGYVEAHGTGTSLGDPIEMQALGAVFSGEARERPLVVGSAKTNLGHLEAAAGVVGLIKTVVALRDGEIPPHLHFTTPSPRIPWDDLPVEVPLGRSPFHPVGGVRRAGVSSFGFSGTNAHVILEEAPEPEARGEERGEVAEDGFRFAERPLHLLALSAPHETALRPLVEKVAASLSERSDAFPDVCFSANTGRSHFPQRLALVAPDASTAAAMLREWLREGSSAGLFTGNGGGHTPALAFVFQGGGGGWTSLHHASPVVRRTLMAADPAFREQTGGSLLEAVEHRDPGEGGENPETRVARESLIQRALSDFWKSLGIEPDVVAAEGMGVLAAAGSLAILGPEGGVRAALASDPEVALEEATLRPPVGRYLSLASGAVLDASELTRGAVLAREFAGENGTGWRSGAWEAEGVGRVVLLGSAGPQSGNAWRDELEGRVVVGSSGAEAEGWRELLEGVARLYVEGVDPDWGALELGHFRMRVPFPGYPFQRRRFWLDSGSTAEEADTVSPWDEATGAARERSGLVPLDMELSSYPATWAALEALAEGLGRNSLIRLGAFDHEGGGRTLEEILKATGIGTLYRPIVRRWLQAMVKRGELERVGTGWKAPGPLAEEEPALLWERAEAAMASDPALMRYIRHSGERLQDVLAGSTSALETLFPDGSFDLARELYESAAPLRYVNGIAASALRAWVQARPDGAAVRVLEVGAGTGGTTSSLIPVLPTGRSSYDFTDVSEVFLEFGRRKFEGVDFLRTGFFDLEKDPSEQGREPGSVDVVVGSNVLHAVRNLRVALKRVRSLLAPGGLLLLVESTGHHAWHDITTGLIEGWQHFEDDIRTETPLLPPERWHALLEEAGFVATAAAPAAGSPAGILKQHVLLARAPGEAASSPTGVTLAPPREPAGEDKPQGESDSGAAEREPSLVDRLAQGSEKQALDRVMEAVRDCVMEVLRWDPDRPPSKDARLMELGVDSLMAVRLRNLVQDRLELGFPLPSTLVFDHPTIRHIARLVVTRVTENAGGEIPNSRARGAEVDGRDEVDSGATKFDAVERAREVEALSDADVEALLLKRLDREEEG